MKSHAKDFRISETSKVKLSDWTTCTKPFYKSDKQYLKYLGQGVENLSAQQINPQGCQVFSFKHPSAAERGRIGIFNRS